MKNWNAASAAWIHPTYDIPGWRGDRELSDACLLAFCRWLLGEVLWESQANTCENFQVSRIFKWVFAGPGGGFWLYNLAGFSGRAKIEQFRVYNPMKPHLCPTHPIEDTNDLYRKFLCKRLDPTELEHTVVQSRPRAFRCMSVCRDPMAGSEDISSFLLVPYIFSRAQTHHLFFSRN